MKTPDSPGALPANRETSIGRQHVESEASLRSVLDFPRTPFEVDGFAAAGAGERQILSIDEATGAATERVTLRAGFTAPIGHFSQDVELFVLSGELRQGGFPLRKGSYSFIPADMVVGPWEASEDTVLLWMPDARLGYATGDYARLPQIAENAVYHKRTQHHPRMAEYTPIKELSAMQWEHTTFLPAGAARKSLYTSRDTGRATWILGVVPMWLEGNFLAGHPTIEEAYCITGDIHGHWSMQDAPFERRYAAMTRDGYYWRPAHVPHGPFWSENGALLLFRTTDRLDCHWLLHNPDITQRDQERARERR